MCMQYPLKKKQKVKKVFSSLKVDLLVHMARIFRKYKKNHVFKENKNYMFIFENFC